MPDFDIYILEIKENNKTLFEAEKIKISPSSLEKLLKKSFWAGFRYCEEMEKLKKDSGVDNNFGNIFGDLFGGKK